MRLALLVRLVLPLVQRQALVVILGSTQHPFRRLDRLAALRAATAAVHLESLLLVARQQAATQPEQGALKIAVVPLALQGLLQPLVRLAAVALVGQMETVPLVATLLHLVRPLLDQAAAGLAAVLPVLFLSLAEALAALVATIQMVLVAVPPEDLHPQARLRHHLAVLAVAAVIMQP